MDLANGIMGLSSTDRERVIGIDLGTTNACVAVVESGVPMVIPNSQGQTLLPAVVAVASLVVNRGKWRRSASQVAADVLRAYFCDAGACRPDPPERRAQGTSVGAGGPPPA